MYIIPAPEPESNSSIKPRHISRDLTGVFRHPFHWREGGEDDRYARLEDRALPVIERNMCAMSATIRSKPSWWTKYTDPAIRARWKAEAIGASVPYGDVPLKEEEVEYVLDELAHYATVRDPETGIEASVAVRIWQSDTLVEEALREQLLACVAKLEDVPDGAKDWHPRSDGQVLDLVHPSMYPVVYGRTLASSDPSPKPDNDDWKIPDFFSDIDDNLAQFIPFPQYKDGEPRSSSTYVNYHRRTSVDDTFVSDRFQWLPTDFAVSADGASARALGYINNLEPSAHREAYPVIERLVARFVPLWERVLGETAFAYPPPARVNDFWDEEYVDCQPGEDPDSGLEDENQRKVVVPPKLLGPFKGYPAPPVVDLKGRTLQVIVKLANIYLTPEKPNYPGGSWHVEGMVNEAIISSGIYYYDEDNVTESQLAFRTAIDGPYIGEDDAGLGVTFELEREEPLVQTLGAVVTKAGRCIAFPNIYQHQVQPFSLADTSKPGHRKILALFLVDPCLKQPRPSTTIVPAQQREWMVATIRELAASSESRLARLPAEVLDIITDAIDGLMSRVEAEAVRLELMDERSSMNQKNTEQTFAVPFNFCEH